MKKLICLITISLSVAASLAVFPSITIAQPEDENKFLLMYFKEEELVVESPTRGKKSITQVAENITVVTADDIKMMNAHTLADVLNTVTGVQVFMTGGPGSQAPGFIQGSDQKHVTVMIDGVVLNNISDGVRDLGVIPVQMIEKIEIIKGPASSAWGSALGGVVNIITKSGGTGIDQGGTLSASDGTAMTSDLRAETWGKQDKVGYYLTAGRLQSDGLTPGFDVAENNAYAKLNYNITDKTNVLLTFGYEKGSRGDGLYSDYDLSFGDTFEIMHTTLSINSALSKDLEVNLSLRSIRQESDIDTSQLSTGLLQEEDTYYERGNGASAKLTWKNTYQTIVVGADYDRRTLESSTIASEQGLTKSAVFMNDTIMIDKFSITPGVRYEDTNTNGDITSPSLGITYSLANNTILRAYTAKGFSIPPISYTYGNTSFYTPNPDLKMETVQSYQVGAETSALKYLWMKVSVFRNDVRDAVTFETISATSSMAVNSGRQRRQGLEVEMKTAPVYNTFISAGAEYIDAKDLDTGQKVYDIPTTVYDLGLHYDDQRSFKALLQGRYINWNATQSDQGEYGSFIVNLNMIKTIYKRKDASLEAFIDVHNIFNGSQYVMSVYPNPERWFEGGIRYTF